MSQPNLRHKNISPNYNGIIFDLILNNYNIDDEIAY